MRTPEVSIDVDRRTIRVDRREFTVMPKLYDVLRVLAEAGGKVVTREQIGREVWGQDWANAAIDSRSVDQAVARLRRAIGDGAIRTVTHHGYASTVKICTESRKWGVIRGIDPKGYVRVAVDFDTLPALKVGGMVRVA